MYGEADVTVSTVIFKVAPDTDGSALAGAF